MTESDISKEKWLKAFPLASYLPPLHAPSEQDQQLAERFRPILYAKPKLIERERKFLLKNLHREDIADSLFLFGLGAFPEDTTAAQLRLLGPALKGIPESEEKARTRLVAYRIIPHEARKILQQIPKHLLEARVLELFEQLFPPKKPTCILKYTLTRHSEDPSLICIQYFSYWPIQLFPRHVHDYEPINIYIKQYSEKGETRFEPLLVSYNAHQHSMFQNIRGIFRRKRPGHYIPTHINWEHVFITEEIFNPMTDFMTKAYGGQYAYKAIESRMQSHTDRILSKDGHPILNIPADWHTYEIASLEIQDKYSPLDVDLHPLKTQDGLHIEWALLNPFLAPFLYPNIGKKTPLMHAPLDLLRLTDKDRLDRWSQYALFSAHLTQMDWHPLVVNTHDYQYGILAELLNRLVNGPPLVSLWKKLEEIDSFRRQFSPLIEHVNYIRRLYQRNREEYFSRIETENLWVGVDTKTILKALEEILPILTEKRPPPPGLAVIVEYEPPTPETLSEYLIYAATLNAHTGQLDKAIANLDEAIETYPKEWTTYFIRGIFNEKAERYDQALADYEKAFDLSRFKGGLYFQGRLLQRMGRLEDALDKVNKLIKGKPLDPNHYLLRAALLDEAGKQDKALFDYTRSIRLNPLNASAYRQRGIFWYKQTRLENALKDLNRAILLDSRNAEAFYYRGLVHAALNQPEKAQPDFEKASALSSRISDEKVREELQEKIRNHIK